MVGMHAKALMDVAELAALTGIPPGRLYLALEKGAIPGVVRIGRRIFFKRAVVERWLADDDSEATTHAAPPI